jgi:hypothetical protein
MLKNRVEFVGFGVVNESKTADGMTKIKIRGFKRNLKIIQR